MAGDARGWSHCGEGCSAPPGCWVLVPPASPRNPGAAPRARSSEPRNGAFAAAQSLPLPPQCRAEGCEPPGCCPAYRFVPQFPHPPPQSDGEGTGRSLGWRSPSGKGKGELGGCSGERWERGDGAQGGVRRVPREPFKGAAHIPQLCLPPPQRPFPGFQFSSGANGMGSLSLPATPRASVIPGHGHSLPEGVPIFSIPPKSCSGCEFSPCSALAPVPRVAGWDARPPDPIPAMGADKRSGGDVCPRASRAHCQATGSQK